MNTSLIAGFFGKLPSRGDFVRTDLPADFIAPWDIWCQRMMAESRRVLDDRWEAAWLQAPVWRFALPQGGCGEGAVLGVWLPSVDCVGRHFPLTIAAVAACALPELVVQAGGFLEHAEQAGRDALTLALDPADLTRRVADAVQLAPVPDAALQTQMGWWTEGSPTVAPVAFDIAGLPSAGLVVHMLIDTEIGSQSDMPADRQPGGAPDTQIDAQTKTQIDTGLGP